MLFCNIDFKVKNMGEILKSNKGMMCVIPVNAQVIVRANQNKRLLDFINNNNAVFDGQVPLLKARKTNRMFNEYKKLSGSDIVYDFCEFSKCNGHSVFFLGGEAESNRLAVEEIRKKYEGINISGFSPEYEPYPFSDKFTNECKKYISDFKPDVLFIGFGVPKQEFYTEENYEWMKNLGIKFIVMCGGTFDFISGKFKRAPRWIQDLGLEGIYRLLVQFNFMRIHRILESLKFFRYV